MTLARNCILQMRDPLHQFHRHLDVMHLSLYNFKIYRVHNLVSYNLNLRSISGHGFSNRSIFTHSSSTTVLEYLNNTSVDELPFHIRGRRQKLKIHH